MTGTERTLTSTEQVSLQKEFETVCRAWYSAGQANNGISFDPFAGEFVKQARESATKFIARLAKLGVL